MRRIALCLGIAAWLALTSAHAGNLTVLPSCTPDSGTSEQREQLRANALETIEKHNQEYSSGLHTYRLGINPYADWTPEEFHSMLGTSNKFRNRENESVGRFMGLPKHIKVPEAIDWREKGVVTPVKNQGQCGSCWAFSATGSLESFYALQNKLKGDDLKQFSEQELVDCSGAQGNEGCGGGLMNYAFDYVIKNKIAIEEEYPYRAKNMKCKADKTKTRYTLAEYKTLTKETANVEELAKLIKTQPISVAFEVQEDFFDYKSGVYKASSDCGDALNHGVLAVGYNTKKKVPYFIVKNSWAESWGLKGYFLMAIGKGRGTCGIANPWDTYPTKI